jgi:hypothetical protein
MKKLIAFLFVCGFAVSVVSCGQKSDNNETATDTTTTVTEPAPVAADTTSADTTTVAPADTTAAK